MRDGKRLNTKIFTPRLRQGSGAAGPAVAAADHLQAHAVRHPGSGGQLQRVLQGAGRRGLHLRVSGHPREVRLRRRLRDAAAAAGGSTRPKDRDRRRHRHLRHHRVAAQERAATTTAASACSACRTTAGRPSWARIEPHPALKAISPQASPADMWIGDDFHHNGAFRLSYGFEYAAMIESGKDVQQLHVRPLRHVRLVPEPRTARRTSTRST